ARTTEAVPARLHPIPGKSRGLAPCYSVRFINADMSEKTCNVSAVRCGKNASGTGEGKVHSHKKNGPEFTQYGMQTACLRLGFVVLHAPVAHIVLAQEVAARIR
ncbi:unnamed protein product, partial [Ectocarpus sp. 13 AM-2016]